MARLTWQPVQAPQGSTRDIAIAGQQIGNSFDRMGQMLMDREKMLRSRATDGAVAEAFMAGTPEEIAALRARGLAGLDKRVDAAEYARSLGTAENDMLDRTNTREDLLNKQAAASLGDEGAALLAAAARGDQAAMQQVEANAAQDPLWGRVAQGYMKDATSAFGDADTRRMTGERDAAQASYQQGSLANDRSRVGLDARRVSLLEQQVAEQKRERLLGKKADAFGRAFARDWIGGMKPSHIPDAQTAVTLARRNIGHLPAEKQQAIIANIESEFGRRFTATEGETDAVTAKFPGMGAAVADAKTQQSRLTDGAYRANQGLMVKHRVAAMTPEYVAELTFPGIEAKLKGRNLRNPADFITNALARGHSLAEVDAMADAADISSPGFLESVGSKVGLRTVQGAATGGTIGTGVGAVAGAPLLGVGAIPGAAAGAATGTGIGAATGATAGAIEGTYDWMTGGTKKASGVLNAVGDTDVVEAAAVELDRSTQGIREALSEQQRLMTLAAQEDAAGELSASTKARIARNEKRLKDLAKKR